MTSVNSQITDSVQLAQQFTIGSAASQSLATLHLVAANALGLAMHNAVTAQQRSQMQCEAATTSTCAQLLALASASAPNAKP